MHCKYMLVDKNIAWLTSGNLEPDYFLNSRNVGICIEGKAPAKTFQEIFYKSWNSHYAKEIVAGKEYPKPRIEE